MNLNEERILALNLEKRQVISTLMMDLRPQNASFRVEFGGQEMYLIGRSEQKRTYESDMMEKVRTFGDVSFNMYNISAISQEGGLNEIRRENQSYERTVGVDYLGNYQMARDYIESVIEETPVPVGAEIQFGGGFFGFSNDDSSRNVIFIGLLSLLSVWMIVSALLESIKYPIFVIMAVPFSLIGIMLGALVNDLAFDRGAIAGALLCIGVVVNNAILIYHQKQLEHGKGIFGLRCWLYVYKKRMRAILITTVTTVTGLLPMMIFGSNEFWENLAIVVIWGLSISTILLLIMTGLRVGSDGKSDMVME
jgi:multidrug efflux pump subunit AcrB